MIDRVIRNWQEWKNEELEDIDLINELLNIDNSEEEISERFYRDLEFGTGGLRGVIGVGTNRMNIYTVAKACQGHSNYLNKYNISPTVAIAYDSRIKSEIFAKRAAEVYAANGIKAFIYSELMPTPSLSFAVRELKCSAGIVVTASHNPSKYNGYKVYGSDGCQITTETAEEILNEINKLHIFRDVKKVSFDNAVLQNKITYIDEVVVKSYINNVTIQSLCDKDINKDFTIVYTPLNGSGLKCVKTALVNNGFTNLIIVKEQEKPDGNFPTCPYPNPEIREALELGIRCAKNVGGGLLLATDPDCDRVGIAIRHNQEYVLLSGNEVGMLLFDYICKRKIELGLMPENPILIKTIVTIDMVDKIAKYYGVKVIDVLTGFKFIGEQIGKLEAKGEIERYIFGFEESYGYLTGTYVRDKDAVSASLMICEMFAYYKSQGKSLIDELNNLYKQFGFCQNTLHSYVFEGIKGFEKMQYIMKDFRNNPMNKLAGKKIIKINDYLDGINDLPKSDVLKYILEDNTSMVIRPSGTEPKIKLYLSISGENSDITSNIESSIIDEITKIML